MKKIYFLTTLLILFSYNIFSQNSYIKYEGIWEFLPSNGKETTFKVFSLFKKNKQLEITFWKKNNSIDIEGSPYTYFGFWDVLINEPQPKYILDIKPNGKYIFFYDKLIKNDNSKNKIGYDSLGYLFQPTRKCEWNIHEKLPNHQKTLELYFNMEPDVYKKVDEIPDYVLISLKKNKEHWQRYLEFWGEKEGSIHVQKSFIYSQPNKQTKMYLLKDDEVEIIEEKENWLHIRYYGKKTIDGWIKKSDVE
ncbi:MAG: hypothetical protein Q8K92_04325 [Leadbetterella sp.]|nr:hypothetical protein [Leadbetterella sp.]